MWSLQKNEHGELQTENYMHKDYVITNTDSYGGDINQSKYEQSMRKMVNKHPDMFADRKWDKWRETKEEKENDANNQSAGRESENDQEQWREQQLREYADIPL